MRKKRKTDFPVLLFAVTLLLVGAAAYVYKSTRLEDEDMDFDLYDEDSNIYY
ncbi:hypothetical protein [Pontibacter ruber]|uniref:Cbb3-type cytochrome oxidase assembly protein CcoS n=1 Tax=Pontibacter ruber TaxID=1343895 RepID=A0ABW5CRX4_9BACT|nr:hypothetical protein [Pontibacter ruber]